MICIGVKGATGRKAALIEDAVVFAFQCLMPRVRKEVDIEVICRRLKGAEGYELETGDREFQIDIHNKLKGDDLLTCIFHEVTHVVQDLRGTRTVEMEQLPYLERPYEIEAYEQQEIILKKWLTNV
tara:strand:- start:309 stop:686 length:378 start_codon:yes stop_codon:yes gene_type:complete